MLQRPREPGLLRPAQAVRQRAVIVVHGVEFGLFAAFDPVPGAIRFTQQVRDFAQGVAVVQGDPVEQLLIQLHGQAFVEWVRPVMRFRRAASCR